MRWNEVYESTGEEICIVQHSQTGKFQYATDNGILDLGDTLPGAVRALIKTGIVPTHYLTKDNRFLEIPKAVMPKLGEANDVVPAAHKPRATLTGAHRDGLTLEQAVKYLQQYPDGALHHDVFERENFVYLTRQGDWRFFDHTQNKVEAWDWKTDIEALVKYADSYDMQSGWWYEPYDWKSELTGETDWFDKLLDGGQ